jgi:B-box zinc finger
MTTMSAAPTTSAEMRCSRHPNTPTLLRCGRCGTPICPRCMINTEVGQRCPDCGRGGRLPTYRVTPAILARGAVAGLLTATAIGYLWSLVPAFGFWIGLLMGFVAGEAVARATNVKRGPAMMATAAASVVLGFLLGFLLLGRGVGVEGLLAVLVNPLLLMRLGLFTLLGVALAAVIAAVRQRG